MSKWRHKHSIVTHKYQVIKTFYFGMLVSFFFIFLVIKALYPPFLDDVVNWLGRSCSVDIQSRYAQRIQYHAMGSNNFYLGGYFFKWRTVLYFFLKTGKRYRSNSFCIVICGKFVLGSSFFNFRSYPVTS